MGVRGGPGSAGLRRVHVLLIEVPGWADCRMLVEADLARRGWMPALSPADADVLVVCGVPGPELGLVRDRIWGQLPGPRAQAEVVTVESVSTALDGAAARLADTAWQVDDSRTRDQKPSGIAENDKAGGHVHAGMDMTGHEHHAGMDMSGGAHNDMAEGHTDVSPVDGSGAHDSQTPASTTPARAMPAAVRRPTAVPKPKKSAHAGIDMSEHNHDGDAGKHEHHAGMDMSEHNHDGDAGKHEHHDGMDMSGHEHHAGMDMDMSEHHAGMDMTGHNHAGMDMSGHGSMDMSPGGIPLASGEDDRDGLEMDVLNVPFGPALPYWPAGLVMWCVLHGDVIAKAQVQLLGAGAVPSGDGVPSETSAGEARTRVILLCDDAFTLLSLAGWPSGASAAVRVRNELLRGGALADAALDLARLRRRVTRSWLLRWSLTGIRTAGSSTDNAHGATGADAGDIRHRLIEWLTEAEGVCQSGPISTSMHEEHHQAQLLSAIPALVEGMDVASARLAIAGLGLHTAALAEIEVVTHG